MDMHYQDAYDVECKGEKLKNKLNLIYENDHNVVDLRHLKNTWNAKISNGNENMTSCQSQKLLRK